MFFKNYAAIAAFLLSGSLATPLNQIMARQEEVCPPGSPITQVNVEIQEVNVPVLINSFIEDNTVIDINGGVHVSGLAS
jgi:hypothetical protein